MHSYSSYCFGYCLVGLSGFLLVSATAHWLSAVLIGCDCLSLAVRRPFVGGSLAVHLGLIRKVIQKWALAKHLATFKEPRERFNGQRVVPSSALQTRIGFLQFDG